MRPRRIPRPSGTPHFLFSVSPVGPTLFHFFSPSHVEFTSVEAFEERRITRKEAGRHGEERSFGGSGQPLQSQFQVIFQTSGPYLKRFVSVLTVRRLLYKSSRDCVKNGRAHAIPIPSKKVASDHTHPAYMSNQHRSAILRRLITTASILDDYIFEMFLEVVTPREELI